MANQTDRLLNLDRLLSRTAGVTLQTMMDELEVSRATVKRDLSFMRTTLGTPILYDRDTKVYRIDSVSSLGERSEIPGMWFSSKEMHALLASHQLLSGVEPDGALNRHVGPLLERIQKLVGFESTDTADAMTRVCIVIAGGRPVKAKFFEAASNALFTRKRMSLQYFGRYRKEHSERTVSPQRLVFYRGTWYLDAFCHAKQGLRRFSLDAINSVHVLEDDATTFSVEEVVHALDQGYGVSAGGAVTWARLLFNATAATWVAHEKWHPSQQLLAHEDGSLEMRIPFTDSTELQMEILRHGPNVEVLEPELLKQDIKTAVLAILKKYEIEK